MNFRLVAVAATAQAGPRVLDPTHPLPTCKPMADDPTKADLNQPRATRGGSRASARRRS